MKKRVILFLILLITLSYGCTQAEVKEEMQEAGELSEMDTKPLVADEPAEILEEGAAEETSMEPPEELKKPSWAYEGITLPGNYADSDILKLDDGKYRMYYALEPEVPGFRGQVYSALSSDGIDWEKEGERLSGISFPSVLQIPNGKFRMYFQEAGVIKSAISPDGLSWEKEPGIRVDTSNTNGFSFENVAAPTVIREGEEYIMVYSGLMNEQYSDELLPNRDSGQPQRMALHLRKRGLLWTAEAQPSKDSWMALNWYNGMTDQYGFFSGDILEYMNLNLQAVCSLNPKWFTRQRMMTPCTHFPLTLQGILR